MEGSCEGVPACRHAHVGQEARFGRFLQARRPADMLAVSRGPLVYGYRMSLWAEHLGTVEECFRRPETEECVRRVNEMAEENWQRYVSPDMEEMRGHLLRYPVQVGKGGQVGPLPGHECFPDVGGKVLGTQSWLLNALTT